MLEKGNENFINLAWERSNFYFFLSSLFLTPPTADTLGTLREIAAFSVNSSFISNGTKQLISELENINNEDFRSLVQEYHDLFKVPLSKFVTPYESVYRHGCMSGKSGVDVKKIYTRLGFQIPNEYHELPDHIGTELAFMATLCKEEEKAYKENNPKLITSLQKMEKKFLKEHILCWLPDLCEKIFEKTKNNFYLAIAKITLDFVLSDSNTLNCAFIKG